MDAFLAMLVKSRLHEFDRGWRKHMVANLRAQERERRPQGFERWKLVKLVELLPILTKASLLYFGIDLLVLLFPIHLISAAIPSLALVTGLSFYAFATFLTIVDIYAPLSSPISCGVSILVNALQATWATWCERSGCGSRPNTAQRNETTFTEHTAIMRHTFCTVIGRKQAFV